MKKSNYIFRGDKVSIAQHWTGEWKVIDSFTGKVIYLVADKDRALEEYDRINKT
jgi:hypothetical protein